jgi:hypothetical protein
MADTESSGAPSGAVAEVKEKGAEVVSGAQEQVQAKAAELKDQAAFQFSEQVNERSTQVGDQVQAFGQVLRSGAEQLRSQGKNPPATIADQAGQRAEDFGRYLRSADADRIMRDVENFARRRPWLSASAAVLVGFVASRFVKASSERRYEASQGNGSGVWSPSESSLGSGTSYQTPTYPTTERSLPTGRAG